MISALLFSTSSYVYAELTAIGLTSDEINSTHDWFGVHIVGTRQSDTAWGLDGDNYMAGMVASQRLPSEGIAGFAILRTPDVDNIFGEGTGYKVFIQFWNDPENYIAFGLIKDLGAAPWGGLTLMIEGASYGNPIGGYWPQGHAGFDGSMDTFFDVYWFFDRIEITVNPSSEQNQTLIYNINMSNPSLACLGAARMPGDKVDAGIVVVDFSGNMSPPFTLPITLVTWDPEFKILGTTYTSSVQ